MGTSAKKTERAFPPEWSPYPGREMTLTSFPPLPPANIKPSHGPPSFPNRAAYTEHGVAFAFAFSSPFASGTTPNGTSYMNMKVPRSNACKGRRVRHDPHKTCARAPSSFNGVTWIESPHTCGPRTRRTDVGPARASHIWSVLSHPPLTKTS